MVSVRGDTRTGPPIDVIMATLSSLLSISKLSGSGGGVYPTVSDVFPEAVRVWDGRVHVSPRPADRLSYIS